MKIRKEQLNVANKKFINYYNNKTFNFEKKINSNYIKFSDYNVPLKKLLRQKHLKHKKQGKFRFSNF